MNQELSLIVHVKTYGLMPNTIFVPLYKDTIEDLDKYTLAYQNKQTFFNAKKNQIMKEILLNQNQFQIQIPPTDLELDENGIYLKGNNKKYAPLFQTITINQKEYPLLPVVKKRFFKRIKDLYEADKKNQEIPEYESIFLKSKKDVLERLEIGIYSQKDFEYLWELLKKSSCFSNIIRFVLSNSNILNNQINIKKVTPSEEKTSAKKTRELWLPYSDN